MPSRDRPADSLALLNAAQMAIAFVAIAHNPLDTAAPSLVSCALHAVGFTNIRPGRYILPAAGLTSPFLRPGKGPHR